MKTALMAMVCAAVVIGGRDSYAASAKELFDQQIAAYKQAGERVEPREFGSRGLSDEKNAVVEIRLAEKEVAAPSAAWDAYQTLDHPSLPLTQQEVAIIQAVSLDKKAALEQLDLSMGGREVDWAIDMKSPVLNVLLPDLNHVRGLSDLAGDEALLRHQLGNDAQAMWGVRRVHHLGTAVAQMPTLVAHLVSVAVLRNAARTAELIAPDLRIKEGTSVDSKATGELIAMFLDDRPIREGQQLALLSERMFQIDIVRCTANKAIDPNVLAGFSAKGVPGNSIKISDEMAYADGLLMVRQTTAIATAARDASDWPTLKKNLPVLDPTSFGKEKSRHLLLNLVWPSFDGALRRRFEVTADQRLAAVALAVRWYGVEHSGERPKTLDDLVPKYLPAVPRDPMAVDQPLKYINNDKKWIVYSVGEDGIDDAGVDKAGKKKGTTNPTRWQAFDAVLHLDRQTRK